MNAMNGPVSICSMLRESIVHPGPRPHQTSSAALLLTLLHCPSRALAGVCLCTSSVVEILPLRFTVSVCSICGVYSRCVLHKTCGVCGLHCIACVVWAVSVGCVPSTNSSLCLTHANLTTLPPACLHSTTPNRRCRQAKYAHTTKQR